MGRDEGSGGTRNGSHVRIPTVEDFIDEVHLSIAHMADSFTNQEAEEAVHLHLIRSHCDGRAKEFTRSLPVR